MIHLLQLLKFIKTSELDDFYEMFGDLDFEINEMGWEPGELIKDMLFNHYGIELLDDYQTKQISEKMLDKSLFLSAINTIKIQRGAE